MHTWNKEMETKRHYSHSLFPASWNCIQRHWHKYYTWLVKEMGPKQYCHIQSPAELNTFLLMWWQYLLLEYTWLFEYYKKGWHYTLLTPILGRQTWFREHLQTDFGMPNVIVHCKIESMNVIQNCHRSHTKLKNLYNSCGKFVWHSYFRFYSACDVKLESPPP